MQLEDVEACEIFSNGSVLSADSTAVTSHNDFDIEGSDNEARHHLYAQSSFI